MTPYSAPSRFDRRVPAGAVRGGSVLVVVLVVVLLLTLGAYTFTRVMLSELESTVMFERDVRARVMADSAVELAAAVLGERTDALSRTSIYDNPALFNLLMHDSDMARGRGSFALVAPRENDNGANPIRFGLVDESSKLNLNALMSYDLEEDEQQELLMALPGMTADVANAILDWIDEDETPRQFGAENEYYGSLDPPYEARNGPLESLDELLRVRGVTYELLFGEDANRNGLLDANENDGDASPPFDNADGVLDRGWSAYLTVLSREANRRADGELRIDVNQDDLAALYDALLAEFDEEQALFITAYRLNGADEEESSGRSSGGGSGGGNRSGSGGGGGGRGGGGQSGGQQGSGSQTGSAAETRGGLELSGSGSPIESLYELIGSTVTAEINGSETKLESPWKNEPSSIQADLPALLDKLTTSSEPFIEGRINIAQAPREVLLAIPQIDEQVVEAIVGAQAAGGAAAFDAAGPRSTTGWLLTEGLVDVEEMRSLDRYITARGDVYRMQAVGYYDAGGPATRLEAIIDATQIPARIVSVRDLSDLGRGYPLQPSRASN